MKTREVCVTALLAVLILITGMFKIPGIIAGTEFQLSAPVSVAICACFGFRRYFFAGIAASTISFLMGVQNFLNVSVSLTFRIAAGFLLLLFGSRIIPLLIAGPFGTVCARLILSLITGVNPLVLISAAAPGMLYTALTVIPIYKIFKKVIYAARIEDLMVAENYNLFSGLKGK